MMGRRYCTEQSWEQSAAQLLQKLPRPLLEQWDEATQSVCHAADAADQDGTIDPQWVVGCDDRLKRALLKEFRRMDEP
jgi:hypothetical protein